MQVLNSGKFKLLAELLPSLKADGHRPLLFSQWTSVRLRKLRQSLPPHAALHCRGSEANIIGQRQLNCRLVLVVLRPHVIIHI